MNRRRAGRDRPRGARYGRGGRGRHRYGGDHNSGIPMPISRYNIRPPFRGLGRQVVPPIPPRMPQNEGMMNSRNSGNRGIQNWDRRHGNFPPKSWNYFPRQHYDMNDHIGLEKRYNASDFPQEVNHQPFMDYEMETNYNRPVMAPDHMDDRSNNYREPEVDLGDVMRYRPVEMGPYSVVHHRNAIHQYQQDVAMESVSASPSATLDSDNIATTPKEAADGSPRESVQSESSSDDREFIREASELDMSYNLGNFPAEFEPQALFERKMQMFGCKDGFYGRPVTTNYGSNGKSGSQSSSSCGADTRTVTDTSRSCVSGINRSNSASSETSRTDAPMMSNHPVQTFSPMNIESAYSGDVRRRTNVTHQTQSRPSSAPHFSTESRNVQLTPPNQPILPPLPRPSSVPNQTSQTDNKELFEHSTPFFSLQDMSAFPPPQASRRSKTPPAQCAYSNVPVGRGNLKPAKRDQTEYKVASEAKVGRRNDRKSKGRAVIGAGWTMPKVDELDRFTPASKPLVPYGTDSSKSSASGGSDISTSAQANLSRVTEKVSESASSLECIRPTSSMPNVVESVGNYSVKRTAVQRGCLLPYFKGPPGMLPASDITESISPTNWQPNQQNDLQMMMETDQYGNVKENVSRGCRFYSTDSGVSVSPTVGYTKAYDFGNDACENMESQENKRLKMSVQTKYETVHYDGASAMPMGPNAMSVMCSQSSGNISQRDSRVIKFRSEINKETTDVCDNEKQNNSKSTSSGWCRSPIKSGTVEAEERSGTGRGRIRHNREFAAVGRDNPTKCANIDYSADVIGMGRSQETLESIESIKALPSLPPETTPYKASLEPVAFSTPVTDGQCLQDNTLHQPSRYVIPAKRLVKLNTQTYKSSPMERFTSPMLEQAEDHKSSYGCADSQQEMYHEDVQMGKSPSFVSCSNEDVVDKFTPQFLRNKLISPSSSFSAHTVVESQNYSPLTYTQSSRIVIGPQNNINDNRSTHLPQQQDTFNTTPTSCTRTVVKPQNLTDRTSADDIVHNRGQYYHDNRSKAPITSGTQSQSWNQAHTLQSPNESLISSSTGSPMLTSGPQNMTRNYQRHSKRSVIGPQATPEQIKSLLQSQGCCDSALSPIINESGGGEVSHQYNVTPSGVAWKQTKENIHMSKNKPAEERRKVLRMNSMGAALARCHDDTKKGLGWGRGRVLTHWAQNASSASAIKFDHAMSSSEQFNTYQEERQRSDVGQPEISWESLRRQSLNVSDSSTNRSQCGNTSSETSSNSFVSFQYTPKIGEASENAGSTHMSKRPGLESISWDWRQRFRDSYFGMTTPFIDTHCHLDFLLNRSGFKGSYAKYREENADTFPPNYSSCVAIFCNPKTWRANYGVQFHKIMEEDGVFAAVGCHPKCATDFRDEQEHILLEMLRHPKIRALGEIGLDYSHSFKESRDIQISVFRKQMEVAKSVNLPLVIHCRDAEQDCIEQLQQVMPKNYKIHRHCFTGTWEEADHWLKLFPNSMIGLTPLVTHRRSYGPRGVAQNIPLNRLLLETDAPYFIPHKVPKSAMEFSHPGMAITVAAEVAMLKNINVEHVLAQCLINSRNFYNLPCK